MKSYRLSYWRFFNFITRRIMAFCFIFGGLILFIYGIPNLFPGATVQVDGQLTDDIVFRLFSVLLPLIVAAMGIFLFRANPYYPSSVLRTMPKEKIDEQ